MKMKFMKSAIISGISCVTFFSSHSVIAESLAQLHENVHYSTFKGEYQDAEFMKVLEEDNKRAEALWQEALKKPGSNVFEFDESAQSNISPRVYTTASASKGFRAPNGMWASVNFYSTFNRINNSIGAVYSLGAYGSDSSTTVSGVTTQYRLIDSGRTLACNYNMVVGVKTYSGDFNYYNKTFYVEFYYNGGGYAF